MSIFVWTLKQDLVQGSSLATTVTHRAEKHRLLECFIMEHLLTATNTFNNEDDWNTNIYTCNYYGCHEPQQIKYILLSVYVPEPSTHRPLHRIAGA